MSGFKKHTLFAGQFIITSVPTLITTVLGSCVAVCLWDTTSLIGGMNHYLLPTSTGLLSGNPNTGNTSIRMLYRSMINRKASPNDLQAKIFGGCNSLYQDSDRFHVGEENIAIAHEVLHELNVPIVAHHTGGTLGRRIVFNTATGKVRMRLLNKQTHQVNEEINKGFGY